MEAQAIRSDLHQLIDKIDDANFLNALREIIRKADFQTEEEYIEPTKEEILANIKEAVKELNLIKQGKLKARPASELLDEL